MKWNTRDRKMKSTAEVNTWHGECKEFSNVQLHDRKSLKERSREREQKLEEKRMPPLLRTALCPFNRGVRRDSFILPVFYPYFSGGLPETKTNPGKERKNEKAKKKKKERKGAATRERINNAAREERGGSAELYVSKAASRVMTRRPIHVRYLGHTWILIHAAIATAVD